MHKGIYIEVKIFLEMCLLWCLWLLWIFNHVFLFPSFSNVTRYIKLFFFLANLELDWESCSSRKIDALMLTKQLRRMCTYGHTTSTVEH